MSHPELKDALVGLARRFGVFERDAICCGTVTVPQCMALQYLLEEPRDVSSIGEQLGVTVSASTRLVDGLVRRGWVERTRDPSDRRRVLVGLSEPGRAEAERLEGLTEQMIDRVLEHVPEGERGSITHSLVLLRDALDRSLESATGCC